MPETAATTSKKKTPKELGLTRVSPGIYRNKEGQLVNTLGRRVDRTGKSVKVPAKKDRTPKTPPPPTGGAFPTPFNQQTPGQQQTNIGTETGESIMQYFNQLQQQGEFHPESYTDTYREAVHNVMGQFELQNREQFEYENANAEQMIAERGIDPQGPQADRIRSQLYDQQDQARQQAMYQGEQMGRALQQQRFEQDLTKYNIPASQLQALQGYFSGQLGSVEAQRQREHESKQAEMDRQNRLQLGRMGGGGGADAMALLNAEYAHKRDLLFDAAAMEGGGNRGPSVGNAFVGGMGQGIGAGIIGAMS